jgi:hypothetical protein
MEVGEVVVLILLQVSKELNPLQRDGELAQLMVGVLVLLLVDQIIVLVILGGKTLILMEATVERVALNVVRKDTCHVNALKEVEDNKEKEEGTLLLLLVVALNVVKRVICQENVRMLPKRNLVVLNAVKKAICLENVQKEETMVIVMGSSKNELALNAEMKVICLGNAQMQGEVVILNKNVPVSNVVMNLICQENVQKLVEMGEDMENLEEVHALNVEKKAMFRRIALRIRVHRNALTAKVKVICQGNVRMSPKRGKDALTVEMNLISRKIAHKNEKKDQIDRIMEIQEEEITQEIVLGSKNLQNPLDLPDGVLQMQQGMVLLVQDGDSLEIMLKEVVLQQEEDGVHQQEDRVHHHNQEEGDGVHLLENRVNHHNQEEEDGVHQEIKLIVLHLVLLAGEAQATIKSLLQEKKTKMQDPEVGGHKHHQHPIILLQVGVNLHHQEK